jgi:ABC-2 type transport system permease protein
MKLGRVLAIVLRQLYLMRGSPARVLPLFAWVAIDIVLWGFITRYLNSVTHAGIDFVPALLGAVLLWDFFSRVMQGVSVAFLEDVWSRNFLNLFATPLSIAEYVAGPRREQRRDEYDRPARDAGLASVAFGLSFVSYGLLLIPFLLVLFLCGIALGIFASAVVLRLGPASEWFVWPVPALISPFAGVFYPVATLPGWMQVVAHLLPPSYVFEGMRTIVAGQPFAASTLLVSIALALFYIALAYLFFARVHRRALRTGLIARYSAETVS